MLKATGREDKRILISLGDLLGGGAGSRKLMDFLIQLQSQAERTGGRVHVVLGDQELLDLTAHETSGDYSEFTDEESGLERKAA